MDKAHVWLWVVGALAGSAGCTSASGAPTSAPGAPTAVPTVEGAPHADGAPGAAGCPSGMAKIPGPGKNAPASGAFCLDLNEVTVADYAACVARGRCAQPVAYAANDRLDQYRAFCNWHRPVPRENHPINCVSFDQAKTFCAKRGARLPTDVEWTWAATNGGTTTFPWGTEMPSAARVNGCGAECPPAVIAATGRHEMKAAYAGNDGFGDTAPGGSFARGDNRWGVHDLAGNVAELVVPVAAPASAGDLAAGGAFLTQSAHFMKGATPTRTAWAGATGADLGFRCAAEAR